MVWDVFRNADCSFFLFLIFFHGVHGADFYTKPNRTVVAFIGSTQTFTWSLNLSAEEKTKVLEAQFGPWDEHYKWVKSYFITFTRKPSGQENETKGSHTMARRLSWTGDLSRNYSVAFQLTNIQLNDTGKYGIKFTVRDFPPHDVYEWFLLSVEYPPVKPTADTRNISLDVEEGKSLNITCRIITEGNPTIVWTRDKKISVQTGQSKLLFIGSVDRSQAGNYVCISMSPTGNRTSPITAVNVLYGPSIDETNKVVPVLGTKGALTTLTCEADGNPPPTFQWRTNDRVISEGVTRTWNSSTLAITPTNDEDFSHYVCTAKNRVGWDAITFNLHEKGPHVAEVQIALEEGDDTRLIKYLSISAVLAVVLVCAFLAQRYVAKRYRQRANQRRKDDPDEPQTWARDLTAVELNQRGIGVNPTFLGDAEWEIPRANLNVEKVIGHGAFGVVSRALALDLPGRPGWTVVAVKSVQEDASEKEKRDLLSEMSVLKNLEPHPHVIRLHGCVSTEDRPLVVVEYAQYGDLLGYLRKSRGMRDNYYSDPSVKPQTSLTSRQLLKFAWEISDGMDYLSTKKIIHRDLAARNVLVGEEEVCKITDFGMARDVQEEDIYVRTHEGRLPIKWTAPEALFGSGAYTTASDVWSYGVVLYEIFTVGGDPFPGVYMREIPTLLKNGYRMSRPKFVSPKLHEIMMECWNNEPSHRPSFASLRSTLHDMKEEEEQEYINLEELFYENVLPTSCLKSPDDERQETCI